MQSVNFSFDQYQIEYDKASAQEKKYGDLHKDCIAYLNQYFFALMTGNHLYWDAKSQAFISYDKMTLMSVFFNRLDKAASNWYFKQNRKLYSICNKINQPAIIGDQINMCEGFKFKNPKKFSEHSPEAQMRAKRFLKFMLEELCSGKINLCQFLEKWIAYMCRGNKNDSALYLKGIQGIGKSFFCEILLGMIGKMGYKSNSDPLLTKFNRALCGKVFVYFEELPSFSVSQWEGINSTLLDIITGHTQSYQDKSEKAFTAENMNNVVICSNVDAIKNCDGRRYNILDLSCKNKNNHPFWKELSDTCRNEECYSALFSYFLEVDLTGYKAQDFPDTNAKLDAIADRMSAVHKFLKIEYLLTNTPINSKLSDLYEEYLKYKLENNIRCKLSKIEFNKKLLELTISPVLIHGCNFIRVSLDRLKDIATKFKWRHELDDVELDGKQIIKTGEEMRKNEIADLKRQLAILEAEEPQEKQEQEHKVEPNQWENSLYDLDELIGFLRTLERNATALENQEQTDSDKYNSIILKIRQLEDWISKKENEQDKMEVVNPRQPHIEKAMKKMMANGKRFGFELPENVKYDDTDNYDSLFDMIGTFKKPLQNENDLDTLLTEFTLQ